MANPVAKTFMTDQSSSYAHKAIPKPPSISRTEHIISGLKVFIYGLKELSSTSTEIAVLWMLHPRLQIQECMAPFAAQFITSWNNDKTKTKKGLIAVSFDQRNHGTREISSIFNQAWRDGNETHALDMFTQFNGTAVDTSNLLDYLAAYIFPGPDDPRHITQNIVFGISLGGHACWHVLMSDPRFSAAIVTIGCPDYTRLMSDRARLSKRASWHGKDGKAKGQKFVGSVDFPTTLLEAVRKYDPARLIWGAGLKGQAGQEHLYEQLTDEQRARLLPLMTRTLGNKRILNLSGGADKLVPYAMGKPFLDWLKKTKDGFFKGAGLYLEDIVVDGAGHEVTPVMVKHMEQFLLETLKTEHGISVEADASTRRDSRI